MNNDKRTTREQAIKWWNKLSDTKRRKLTFQYMNDMPYTFAGIADDNEIHGLYLSEHPTETESERQEPELTVEYDNDDWGQMYRITNGENAAKVTFGWNDDKGEKEAKLFATLLASAPRLAKENKELKEENKLLREALNDLIFNADPSTTSGRTDLEKSINKAKKAINK